jgi:hypothetical protein
MKRSATCHRGKHQVLVECEGYASIDKLVAKAICTPVRGGMCTSGSLNVRTFDLDLDDVVASCKECVEDTRIKLRSMA